MTMIRGVRILAAPCCGKRYASPRYLSMNFMAFEYWTDGWREGSLMPNDSGLRICQCGTFVQIGDLVEIDVQEESDLPRLERVPPEMLPSCIAHSNDDAMELAARLDYLRQLNHAYRVQYRAHRDAEEAAIQATWEVDYRARRSWWKNLVRWPLPTYVRPGNVSITYPPFVASPEQTANMEALVKLMGDRQRDDPRQHRISLAEVYRELGRFEEAAEQIEGLPEIDRGVTSGLIKQLIAEGERAPVRYRM